MIHEQIELTEDFQVNPEVLYNDWLSSEKHSKFTGGEASIQAKEKSKFTAWDEYISGEIIKLEYGKMILQSWRTTEFDENDLDSMLEIIVEPNDSGGTTFKLNHYHIPKDQSKKYADGWIEHYFEPMKAYYNNK